MLTWHLCKLRYLNKLQSCDHLPTCNNLLLASPELIENVKLIHKPVSLQPRGLINKGNWCYINAVSFFPYIFTPLNKVNKDCRTVCF